MVYHLPIGNNFSLVSHSSWCLHIIQEGKTSLDVAKEKGNFKAIKVLLKKKYPVRWRFKLQRMTQLPISASNMSLNSFKSEASSVCSDINVTTAEVDLDNIED